MDLRSSSMDVVLKSRPTGISKWVVGMVEDWIYGEGSRGKYESQNLIGMRVISEKRGI